MPQMSPANEDASVAQWYDKGTPLSRTCLSDPTSLLLHLGLRLFRSDRWFMPCFKNTCYRPSAFPLPCMTKAADSNHIEACLYQTSVCSPVDLRQPLDGTAPGVIPRVGQHRNYKTGRSRWQLRTSYPLGFLPFSLLSFLLPGADMY